jgi:hypothetical protein
MLSQARSRFSRTVAAGLVVAALAAGFAGGATEAHAQRPRQEIGAGRSCEWLGMTFPDGHILNTGNGYVMCEDGTWVPVMFPAGGSKLASRSSALATAPSLER